MFSEKKVWIILSTKISTWRCSMAKVSHDVMIPTETGYTIKKVSDNELRDEMEKFEEGSPDGVYTDNVDTEEPNFEN